MTRAFNFCAGPAALPEEVLKELQEELLQLRAELSLGGRPSNMGAFRTTWRSIVSL